MSQAGHATPFEHLVSDADYVQLRRLVIEHVWRSTAAGPTRARVVQTTVKSSCPGAHLRKAFYSPPAVCAGVCHSYVKRVLFQSLSLLRNCSGQSLLGSQTKLSGRCADPVDSKLQAGGTAAP